MVELVIFDCDGVLVDTEQLANQHISAVLSALGKPMSANECRALFQGKTLEDVCLTYEKMNGLDTDPLLPQILRDTIESAMTSGIKPIAGAVALVNRLMDDEVPVCVASSGSVPKMHKTLGQVGLLERLEKVLFSAQDIGRGKPHPDVFLAAAKAMQSSCDKAVIIEDSLSGVQAGVASGARVLGFAGDPFTNAQDLSGAGAEVFMNMSEAYELITQ